MNFQKLLIDDSNPIVSFINKESYYEEKWNFNFKYNFDLWKNWEFNSKFSLEDYISKVSGWDNQILGKLKVLLSWIDKSKNKWEFWVEFDTLVDLIFKDWDLYLGLKKLNIINDWNQDQIKNIFTKAKDFIKKDKYLKIESSNSRYGYDLQSIIKQQINTIRKYNSSVILNWVKTTLSKPLFEAYKKDWNKYSLVPTKYSCDQAMLILNKMNPWYPAKCSDSDYAEMKKDILKEWEIYLEIAKENKIWYKAFEKNGEKIEIYSKFNKYSVNKIYSKLSVDFTNWFEFNYEKNKKITFNLNDREVTKINFISTLDNKNNFNIKIDYYEKNKKMLY